MLLVFFVLLVLLCLMLNLACVSGLSSLDYPFSFLLHLSPHISHLIVNSTELTTMTSKLRKSNTYTLIAFAFIVKCHCNIILIWWQQIINSSVIILSIVDFKYHHVFIYVFFRLVESDVTTRLKHNVCFLNLVQIHQDRDWVQDSIQRKTIQIFLDLRR
jgi:hypothetical protein